MIKPVGSDSFDLNDLNHILKKHIHHADKVKNGVGRNTNSIVETREIRDDMKMDLKDSPELETPLLILTAAVDLFNKGDISGGIDHIIKSLKALYRVPQSPIVQKYTERMKTLVADIKFGPLKSDLFNHRYMWGALSQRARATLQAVETSFNDIEEALRNGNTLPIRRMSEALHNLKAVPVQDKIALGKPYATVIDGLQSLINLLNDVKPDPNDPLEILGDAAAHIEKVLDTFTIGRSTTTTLKNVKDSVLSARSDLVIGDKNGAKVNLYQAFNYIGSIEQKDKDILVVPLSDLIRKLKLALDQIQSLPSSERPKSQSGRSARRRLKSLGHDLL